MLAVLTILVGACGDSAPGPASAPPEQGPSAATPTEFPVVRPAEASGLGADLLELVAEHVARVEAQPGSGAAHGTLGLVYEANRLWPEAVRCFEQATRLEPGEPVWAGHCARALQQVGRDEHALAVLAAAVERVPDSAVLWNQYGDALFATGDLALASTAFARTVELAPQRAEGFVGLGEVQLALGEAQAALANLDRGLELQPDGKRTHYLRGLALRELGQLAEAQRELELGVGGGRGSIPDAGTQRLAEFVRGFDRLLQRANQLTDSDPAAALEVLAECRRRQPTHPIVLVNLGVAHQRLGQLDEALAALLEADRTNPDLHMVQVNLAACLLALQRPEEALARADHAVALAPSLARAHTLRGRALLALDRGAEAYPALVESARLEPDDPSVHEELGELCLEQGRSEQALVHYRQLCTLLPESWEAQAQLVRAAVLGADLPTARAALEHAQALAPAEPQLAAMAEALAALEVQAALEAHEE